MVDHFILGSTRKMLKNRIVNEIQQGLVVVYSDFKAFQGVDFKVFVLVLLSEIHGDVGKFVVVLWEL